MSRRWTTESPSAEGWYFWRRRGYECDPFYWHAYFIEGEADECSCWENGVCVNWPSDGEWSSVLGGQ